MSKKLNILTATLRYPPAPGGAEKIAQEAVLGMVRKGHQVQVYTSNLKCHNLPNVTWLRPWEYRDDPPYIKRCPTFYLDQFPYPYMKGMASGIFKAKKINLIHGHSFYYYPADIAWFLAKIKRVPYILHPYFYYQSREAKKWHLYRRTIGKLTMKANCIIALSEYEKKLILKFFQPRWIEVIPPGVNPELKKKVLFNIFEKYNLPNKPVILFSGRICSGKGVDVLIRAFARVLKKHPEAVLALAGGDFGDKKDFVKLAQQLKVDQKMIWLGNLEGEKLASAYQNASLFCLPTKYEAFGLVLTEAMAAGLPVVSTNIGAVPYVVPQNEAGFLAPVGNYKKIAYYLDLLLSDEDLRKKMGERGKKEAQKYDWDKMTNKIEEIYYSLVKK